MTKKEYILKILDYLKDDWDLAKWLIVVINKTDNVLLLEKIYNIFKEEVSKIYDKNLKNKLSKAVSSVKKIIEKEKVAREQDIKDLKKLEEELENIF